MSAIRKRRRQLLLVMAGTPVILSLAFAFWIRSLADRRLPLAEREREALQAETRTQDLEVARLRKGSEAGNAWDDYLEACVEAGKIKMPGRLAMGANRIQAVDQEGGRAILPSHGIIVERLCRGADRQDCRYPAADQIFPPELRHFSVVVDVALLTSRSLREQGKLRESVGVLLALLQLARDYGDTGEFNMETTGLM